MSDVHAELSQELEDNLIARLWSTAPRFKPFKVRLVKATRAPFVNDMVLKWLKSSECISVTLAVTD